MMAKPYKPCSVCAKPFPDHKRRVTCSMACRGVLYSRRQKGVPIPHVTVGSIAAGKRRTEAKALAQFGRLSLREVQIFRFAEVLGRKRGYFAQLYREKKARRTQGHAA